MAVAVALDRGSVGGWLRSAAFDRGLIVGVLALALVLGGVAMQSPRLWIAVLTVDVWLLAYPHVTSTYSRIAFDRASVRRHWPLLFALPPLVFVATAGVVAFGGLIALNTLYYLWQSWHYSRQSYGITRVYHRLSAGAQAPRDHLSALVVFAFPVWGLLHRAHQRPSEFFAMPLWTPEVPAIAVTLAGTLALAALAAWTWRHLRAATRGAPRSHGLALFLLSHVVITLVSYVAIADITRGWLFINIWHNAQYILFVWAMNARRFHGAAPSPGPQPLLARLSRPDRWGRYALVGLGLSTAIFVLFDLLTRHSGWQVLPFALVCYQAANFHHYVVDAVIWRRPAIGATPRPHIPAPQRAS